ncbi:MAG: sigma-70 family RNA polymerase sigma factor [Verrucomicrobia bacterium]|nr:sigma-70 family RNA polymerase sigma factor [Verrucomicrobiota bacterium]
MTTHLDPSKWIDIYGEALYSFAYFRTRNREEAEETVQETLFRGLRKIDTFQGKSTLKTWLIAIMKNVLRESARQRQRSFVELESSEFDEAKLEDLRNISPDRALMRAEFWDVVVSCLEKLPNKTAEIFWAKEVEGQSTTKIAVEHGVTDNNVWVLMHRARSFLRKCLSDIFGPKSKRD